MPGRPNSPAFLKPIWIAGCTIILLLALLPVIGPYIVGVDEADWMIFFGRFHIVLLHIPIGVFVWVATMETGRALTRGRWNPDVTWALAFGAMMAAATAVLGYLLLRDAGSTQLLMWHMWTGVAFGGLAMLTFLVNYSGWFKAYLGALAASMVMMTVSAHFGASSVHGKEYLTKYAPVWLQKMLGEEPKKVDAAELKPTAPGQSAEVDTVFAKAIEPMLTAKCGSCHSAEKAKGGLDVSSFAALLKGGEDGAGVVAGKPEESHVLKRMELPLDDDDHMPPKGKPQPSTNDVALLKWWIANGAKLDQKASEIPAELRAAPAAAAPMPAVEPVKADPAVREKLAAEVAQINKQFPSFAALAGKESADLMLSVAAIRTAFKDEDLAKLAPISDAVVDFDLGGSGVTNSGLAALSGMKRLSRLRLENTAVTDAGLPALQNLPGLQSLSLYGCSVTDAGVDALAGIPVLKRIYLGATQITPQGIEALKQKKPGLEVIMPPDASKFPKVAAKPSATAPDPNENPTHFTKVILPVLRKNCAVCHNGERMSGDLNVTTFASLIAAGDGVNENVIVPGDATESLLIKRIKLPIDDKQHMPPKRRPQMTPEEIALLTKWVADGAKEN